MSAIFILSIFLIMMTILQSSTAQDTTTPPGCIISCCVKCKPDNCKDCYTFNREDKETCPCIEDLTPRQRAGLNIGNLDQGKEKEEAELLINSETILPKSSPIRSAIYAEVVKAQQSYLRSLKSPQIPLCQPSCCSSTSCTEETCPLCYRRFKTDPQSCPCINTGFSSTPSSLTRTRW
eukprot:GFUD01069699.1.p1 GENE.GFUD01069699.1~~GFUD01069699.1.p1  ORF type:complete len:178 (-),score=38.76 GFUD01069699.1:60-593(-)